jgi:hypothetical protein
MIQHFRYFLPYNYYYNYFLTKYYALIVHIFLFLLYFSRTFWPIFYLIEF